MTTSKKDHTASNSIYLPSPIEILRPECTLDIYTPNLKKTYHSCYTTCGGEIELAHQSKAKPTTISELSNYGFCSTQTGRESWSKNYDLSTEIEYNRIWKRKPQADIYEDTEHISKKPWNIKTCSDIDIAITNKYTNTKHDNKGKQIIGASYNKEPYYKTSNECLISKKISDLGQTFQKSNPGIKKYSRENMVTSALTSKIHQTFDYDTDGRNITIYPTVTVCNKEPAILDTNLLHILVGETPGVFTRSFIPQSDSPLDYIVPHYGLKNHAFSSRTPHYSASRQDNTEAILSNVNSALQVEPAHKQKPLYCTTDVNTNYQIKHSFAANILADFTKCHVLQKNDLSLPYIDKKTCIFRLFGNNDESLLSTENAFLAQLNYPRQPGEQHFVSDMEHSIFAASLLGTSKNEFSCFRRNSLQSTSKKHTLPETSNKLSCDSVKGRYFEEAERRKFCIKANVFSRKSSLIPKNLLKCQYKYTGNTQHLENYISSIALGNIRAQSCENQNSFTEHFEKISIASSWEEPWVGKIQKSDIVLYDEYQTMHDNLEALNITISEHQFKCAESVCLVNSKNILLESLCTSSVSKVSNKEQDDNTSFSNDKKLNLATSTQIGPNIIGKNISVFVNQHPECTLQVATEMFDLGKHDVNSLLNTKEGPCILSPFKDIAENIYFSNGFVKEECQNMQPYSDEKHLSNNSLGNMVTDMTLPDGTALTQHLKNDATEGKTEDGISFLLTISEDKVQFEMKSQFDLVLEELALFHSISEKDAGSELKHSCEQSTGSLELFHGDCTDNSAIDDSAINIQSAEDNLSKILTQVKEQDVPQGYWSANSAEEEGLYSTDRQG
ncbi:Hypothetical predicted protein [Pelobates cultripes]|uniref:Uncharacterized protein n=1 Tax=Pelobates cultripes TaxID=61616 RepID=A0AAD1RC23_PELCU|nr:Hypothetical predicted protein [Pelobates cultripes]